MSNVTLSYVDVVGITLSSRVKPKTYLWFAVTHVHLLLRSFNNCFKLFKRLDRQGTASAKEIQVKEMGGTTRTSSDRLKKGNVPVCYHSSADMRQGFFLPQLKS